MVVLPLMLFDPSIGASPLLPAGVGLWAISNLHHIQISRVKGSVFMDCRIETCHSYTVIINGSWIVHQRSELSVIYLVNTEHHYEHDILHVCQGSHSKIIVFSKVINLFVESSSAPWPHSQCTNQTNRYLFPNVSLYTNGVTPPRISKPDNPKYRTNSTISFKNIKSISKCNTKYNFVCKE